MPSYCDNRKTQNRKKSSHSSFFINFMNIFRIGSCFKLKTVDFQFQQFPCGVQSQPEISKCYFQMAECECVTIFTQCGNGFKVEVNQHLCNFYVCMALIFPFHQLQSTYLAHRSRPPTLTRKVK